MAHDELARSGGEIVKGWFRVVVIESDTHVTRRDFASLAEACRYADDAASEDEPNPPLASVFDSDCRLVHDGKPYWRE